MCAENWEEEKEQLQRLPGAPGGEEAFRYWKIKEIS